MKRPSISLSKLLTFMLIVGSIPFCAWSKLPVAVIVSGSADVPENAYDNDFSTAWMAYGAGAWIQFSFSDEVTLDGLAISFTRSDERNYYISINVSNDGVNWTEVLNGQSSGVIVGLESFFFPEVTTSYIRIIGGGNSVNAFNNFAEVYFPPLRSTLISGLPIDQPLNVLFLGNSYTEQGPIPYLFKNIATSASWPTPNVSYNILGGQSLTEHSMNVTSMGLVNQGNWDYVVLQDHSQRALSDKNGLYHDMIWFYDTIKSTSPNATVILYETWATLSINKQEDMYVTWSQEYLNDYDSVQTIISTAYENTANNYIPDSATFDPPTDVKVAHVGDAWRVHYNNPNHFRLHEYKDNHANDSGEYLNALMIYSTIYEMAVTGVGFWEIPEAASVHLQSIVNSMFDFKNPDSTSTDIMYFVFTEQTGSAIINKTNHTVNIEVKYGTDITKLSPSIIVSMGATIDPSSGFVRNFASPLNYTVTAQDGTTQQVWTVTVTVANESNTNNSPITDITFDTTMYKGFVYYIDASKSFDPDNQPVIFEWNIPAEISFSLFSDTIISVMPTENCEDKIYNITLSLSDGKETVDTTLNINIKSFRPDIKELNVQNVYASDYEEGNVPQNIIDNNSLTRWSADGDNQWLIFKMDSNIYIISHVKISFYSGESRKSFFELYASLDSINWDLIVENNSSCGFSSELQVFEIPENKMMNLYKYIKLVGHMNTENTWNSYYEIKIYGSADKLNYITNENRNEIVNVYPNPATDIFYISSNHEATIKILDMAGKIVYEQNNYHNIFKIDNKLKTGFYIIEILMENKIYTKQLIVK